MKNQASSVRVTRLTVLGICCAGEVPVIKRILEPLPGVEGVSVNFLTRTATVVHDPSLTSDKHLETVLNEARMEASIQNKGQTGKSKHGVQLVWLCLSGLFLAVSLFHLLWPPLVWLSLVTVFISTPGIALKAVSSLKRLNLDINVLMLTAVIGAVCLSNYIEAATVVFLFSCADWLQQSAVKKASDAIGAAVDLVPETATLAASGHSVPLENINPGTLISVRAEEMVPLDGLVASGSSSINESSLTGESKPVTKSVGDRVWAGTINMYGLIVVETTSTSDDSALSRMMKMVEEAQRKRSRTELYVETFAKYYTPAVLIGALATALVPLFFHASDERQWIYLSLIIVVVACPCALVISTPVTATCSIARAARLGLVIKGGDCLEVLAKINVIAMDKTGTLTQGIFQVLEFFLVDPNLKTSQLLKWVAGVETLSIHPIATAFADYARSLDLQPCVDVTDFKATEGEGVSGIAEGHLIEIGNSRLAARRKWSVPQGDSNGAVSFVGVNGKLAGIFTAADNLRPESRIATQELRNLKIKVLMLTGDSHQTATSISNQLDDIEFHAELLPEDKLNILEQLKSSNQTSVAMVGDGVNDAPALAAAHVGIAMGVAGSAIALDTADIALMTNDLRKLATAVRIGREYRKVVLQNIFLSLATKLLVAVFAAFGYAPLWVAVLADVGTCMLVTLNGTRILLLGDTSSDGAKTTKPSRCVSGCSCSSEITTPLL